MTTPITIVLTAALWALPQLGLTQVYKNEKVVYLDADGNSTKEKRAVSLEQIIPFGDTAWQINLYRMYGPRIKSFWCSDPDGKLLNGSYISYSANGRRDTSGHYKRGQRSGHWYFYTAAGRTAGSQFYENGELLWTKDTLQLKQEADSLATIRNKDTGQVFQKVEIESSFVGGAAGWLTYLNKHLRYPDAEVTKRIQGQVIVVFIVDKTGQIESNSISVDQSVDFGIDEEAIRIILSSPPWTPAIQNGRQVRSYKKQPLIFAFQYK